MAAAMAEVEAEQASEAARNTPMALAKRREQREAIENIYRQHNPQKVGDIGGLIEKYGEVELLRMIRKKYNVVRPLP